MRFKVVIGDQVYAVEVPEEPLREAAEFHSRLDRDMDRGWQHGSVSREPDSASRRVGDRTGECSVLEPDSQVDGPLRCVP